MNPQNQADTTDSKRQANEIWKVSVLGFMKDGGKTIIFYPLGKILGIKLKRHPFVPTRSVEMNKKN